MKQPNNKLLIFRTDIKTKKKVKAVKTLFNSHINILDWSVDLEGIDNVLWIKATKQLAESDITNLIKPKGFYCDVLPGYSDKKTFTFLPHVLLVFLPKYII